MTESTSEEAVEIIPESEVPRLQARVRRWSELFDKIPSGKAMVFRGVNPSTFRSAVKRVREQHHHQGKWKNIYSTARKGEDGKYVVYVVNPAKKTQDHQDEVT